MHRMLECIMIMSSAAQVLGNIMNKMRRSSREDEGDMLEEAASGGGWRST
jgi:hypothetical protein